MLLRGGLAFAGYLWLRKPPQISSLKSLGSEQTRIPFILIHLYIMIYHFNKYDIIMVTCDVIA